MDPEKLNRLLWAELESAPLPEGYTFMPSSELTEKKMLYRRLRNMFLFTVVIIYCLLAVERESLLQPLLILLQLPFIISVPLTVILIFGIRLNTGIILGLILLTGMGINNGILILGRCPCGNISASGVRKSVSLRFDGVFLTTSTSIAGLLPLMFSREPFFTGIGAVLISGLAASFFVSTCLFPVLLGLILPKEGKLRGRGGFRDF